MGYLGRGPKRMPDELADVRRDATKGKHRDRPYFPNPKALGTEEVALVKHSPRDIETPKQTFPEDKGLFGGRCNRGSCLKPGASWFNLSTRAYYCSKCARLLNNDPFNKRDAEALYGGPLCVMHKEKGMPA